MFKVGDNCYIGERYVGIFIGINPINFSYIVFTASGEYKGYHSYQLNRNLP